MSDFSTMFDYIAGLLSDGKVGRVYVYYSVAQSGTMQTGYFSLRPDGRLVLHGAKLRSDAIVAELSGKQIFKMNFIPFAVAATAEPGDEVIDFTELRALLETADSQPQPQPAEATRLAVLESPAPSEHKLGIRNPQRTTTEIVAIMQQYYGGAALQKVAKIVERFPPDHRPIEFLDQCRDLLDAMVGKSKSQSLLQRFYTEANDA